MTALAEAGRLPLLKAAYVIARRDFVAILFSRAFFFFLLGPLFPVVVGVLAGGVGQRVENVTVPPQLGVAMEAADVQAIMAAQQRLHSQLGREMPEMIVLARLGDGETFDAEAALGQRKGGLAGVLSGTPERPTLTVTPGLAWWSGPVGLIAAEAQRSAPSAFPDVQTHTVATSGASEQRARLRTAQAGQLMLFLLTMLLAGMVLSNLVEEKGNKIIEILAAAVPMDAVFLGKLFAMLAISLVGIAVWALAIGSLVGLLDVQGLFGGAIDFTALPAPGVGWAAFLLLAVTYFATGYLLLGSIFLAVGSLATTVREVQTMSMPVTMLQVLLFFFASMAMSAPGTALDWAAMIFPLSSPFAMLARAAQHEALWPHLLALGWQLVWVLLFIRGGATLFRKRVMKSGPQGAKRNRGLRTLVAPLFSRRSRNVL